MKKKITKEIIYKNRCEGWRRYGGGLMNFGPAEWKQCDQEGIVFITFKDKTKEKTLPACSICWNEMIEAKTPKILKVIPIIIKT